MFYFAYGSNMNWTQMQRRCPSSRFVCTARLPGYRLAILSSRLDSLANHWPNNSHLSSVPNLVGRDNPALPVGHRR